MVQTYLSTDWLEVRGRPGAMAKVILTDESEAYLISVAKASREAELFKLDARKLRREDFFNAVTDA